MEIISSAMAVPFPGTDSTEQIQDSYLYEFLFEACEYFSAAGYVCDASEVFQIAEAFAKTGSPLNTKQILRTCFVHSVTQEANFNTLFEDFKAAYFQKQHIGEQTALHRQQHEEKKSKLNKKLEALASAKAQLKEQKSQEKDTKEVAKAKKTEKQQAKIKNLELCLQGQTLLKTFVQQIEAGKIVSKEKLMEEIKTASKTACTKPNAAELMKAIQERGKQLKAVKKGLDTTSNKIEQTNRQIQAAQQQLADEETAFQNKMKEMIKQQSIAHRPEFNSKTAKNVVHSYYKGDALLAKSFNKLSADEKRSISDYIRENTRKFRTRLTKKIRTSQTHQLDVPATIKKSCQTGGIPLQLLHKKPIRQKANLVLILDVSGSCKNASEMMLIFMHAMKEAFPGGCKTYAFTNQLYDISAFFDTDNPDEAAQEVLHAIPRSGAYSNYEKPFRVFYKEHMSDITGDSYVYFIGDARNNKNASGEDFVKAIARKAKKAFWLNTEEREKWDTGDSIMRTYAPYMTQIAETVTPAELLGFLGV